MPEDSDSPPAHDPSFLENFAWSHRPAKKDPGAIHRAGMDIRIHPLLAIPLAYLRHLRIFLVGSCFAGTLGILYYCYSKSLFSTDSEVGVRTSEFTETVPSVPLLTWDLERMRTKLESNKLAEQAAKRLGIRESWRHGIDSVETQPVDTGTPGKYRLGIRVYSHDEMLGLKWGKALFEEYSRLRDKELKQAIAYLQPRLDEAILDARQKILSLESQKEEILGQQKAQQTAVDEWDAVYSTQLHKLEQFAEVLKVWNGHALEPQEKIRLARELYDEFYQGIQDVIKVEGNEEGQTISYLRFGQYGTKIFDLWEEVHTRLQKWSSLLDTPDEPDAEAPVNQQAQENVETLETYISRINEEILKSLEIDYQAIQGETLGIQNQSPPQVEKWRYPLAIEALNHNIQEAVSSYASLLRKTEYLQDPDIVEDMSFLRITGTSDGPIDTGTRDLVGVVLAGAFIFGSLLVFQAGTKWYDIVDPPTAPPQDIPPSTSQDGSPFDIPKESTTPKPSMANHPFPDFVEEELEVPECPEAEEDSSAEDGETSEKIEETAQGKSAKPSKGTGNTNSF